MVVQVVPSVSICRVDRRNAVVRLCEPIIAASEQLTPAVLNPEPRAVVGTLAFVRAFRGHAGS